MEILRKIQQELKVPKTHLNKFANYNYRNAEDILEAVKPLLDDAVLTLSDEVVEIGGRVYVKATASLLVPFKVRDVEPGTYVSGSDPIISVTAYAREPEDKKGSDASQITGAASSYARKYALNGLFLIDDTKDADSEEPVAKVEPPKAIKAAQDSQKKIIKELCDKQNSTLITAEDYQQCVEMRTGLKLEPANYSEIITRLEATEN